MFGTARLLGIKARFSDVQECVARSWWRPLPAGALGWVPLRPPTPEGAPGAAAADASPSHGNAKAFYNGPFLAACDHLIRDARPPTPSGEDATAPRAAGEKQHPQQHLTHGLQQHAPPSNAPQRPLPILNLTPPAAAEDAPTPSLLPVHQRASPPPPSRLARAHAGRRTPLQEIQERAVAAAPSPADKPPPAQLKQLTPNARAGLTALLGPAAGAMLSRHGKLGPHAGDDKENSRPAAAVAETKAPLLVQANAHGAGRSVLGVVPPLPAGGTQQRRR